MLKWRSQISTLAAIASVSSCASTANLQPGNALPGIGLGGSEDMILLSWSEDSPLAQKLRPRTQVNVLAAYDTEFGPVTNEIVSTSTVRAGFPGIKLQLSDTLKFPPSSRVCLRLATGYVPIPVRIATYEQSTAGFYYDEWADIAGHKSEVSALQAQLNTVTINVDNYSTPDPNFEEWRARSGLSGPSGCDTLTAEAIPEKPDTALTGQARTIAAKQQCVALFDMSVKDYGVPPAAEVSAAIPSSSPYHQSATQMARDYAQHRPGRIYFPYSDFPIDVSLLRTLRASAPSEGVPEVAATLVVEAYQACELEALTRFSESERDWNEVSNPTTIAGRREPLRRLCRARFERNDERLQKLEELRLLKSEIEQDLQRLSASNFRSLPREKLLIQDACPAES